MVSFQQFAPALPLRPFIRAYQYLDHPGGTKPSLQRVVPDGCLELNFCLGMDVRRREITGGLTERQLTGVYVVNRTDAPYFLQRTGATRVISVLFYPGAAQRFTSFPLGLLANSTVPAIEVFGKSILHLGERIGNTAGIPEIIGLLNAYWLSTPNRSGQDFRSLNEAVRLIMRPNEGGSVSTLASSSGITRFRLEQLFTEQVGTTPGVLFRLMRFRGALRTIIRKRDTQLAILGESIGYGDQSHLWRDFMMFTGTNPRRYRKEGQPLNNAMMRLFDAAPEHA
ncbi:MAG: helix-turn-helix domain-containing protein [Flavobacteriales bacterium]